MPLPNNDPVFTAEQLSEYFQKRGFEFSAERILELAKSEYIPSGLYQQCLTQ